MDEPVSKSTVAKVADQAHAATDRVAQKATGAITQRVMLSTTRSTRSPSVPTPLDRGRMICWRQAPNTYGRARTPRSALPWRSVTWWAVSEAETNRRFASSRGLRSASYKAQARAQRA